MKVDGGNYGEGEGWEGRGDYGGGVGRGGSCGVPVGRRGSGEEVWGGAFAVAPEAEGDSIGNGCSMARV